MWDFYLFFFFFWIRQISACFTECFKFYIFWFVITILKTCDIFFVSGHSILYFHFYCGLLFLFHRCINIFYVSTIFTGTIKFNLYFDLQILHNSGKTVCRCSAVSCADLNLRRRVHAKPSFQLDPAREPPHPDDRWSLSKLHQASGLYDKVKWTFVKPKKK